MTFLEEVKKELLNIRTKKLCCMKSELRGILMFGGAPYEGNAIFGTDNFELAKTVSTYLRKNCNITNPERLSETAEGYKFVIGEDILRELNLTSGEHIGEIKSEENNQCCMRAFVRGAFLSSGSAANPEKAYRVEVFSTDENAADKVLNIFTAFGVDAKKTKRKNLFVVYANNSESVSDMLKVTEASNAVMHVLGVKVEKDRRNGINRKINCDMANIDRTTLSSQREIEAIRVIERTIGLDALKPVLRETAKLRLENEFASIKELCELYDPPVAKSTLNNRLNKLVQIAESLGE